MAISNVGKKELLGILLVAGVVVMSFFIDRFLGLGVVVIAILVGIIANAIFSFSSQEKYKAGISYAEKDILTAAIVFLGIDLNFEKLSSMGMSLLGIIIFGVVSTIFVGVVIGRLFGFSKKLSFLLGVGNAVCGSTAIAVTKKSINADKADVGISVATVNLLGVLGMFVVPLVALQLLGFSDVSSGILVGNTLQAVGQAVAGGFSISSDAGLIATIVKMTRVLLLLPVVFFALWYFQLSTATEKSGNVEKRNIPKIPLFLFGFVGMAIISSLHILSSDVKEMISFIGNIFLVCAMAGIGLSISIQQNFKKGLKVLGVGLLIFTVQVIISALLISFLL